MIVFGHLVDGGVRGKTTRAENTDQLHGKAGFNRGIKWRFKPASGELFTWTPATERELDFIKAWLASKGHPAVKRSITTHWAKTVMEIEKWKRERGSKQIAESWKTTRERHR